MEPNVKYTWNGVDAKIQIAKAMHSTAFGLGLIVESQAKTLCTVDYGYLAASIMTASVDQQTSLDSPVAKGDEKHTFPHSVNSFKEITPPRSTNEVLVGSAVDYASHVEFGTINSDSQPFLRPALDLAKGKKLTILEKESKKYFGDYLQRPKS